MSKPTNQVKEVNIYLNGGSYLEQTNKTASILIASTAEIVWVKYKNTLTGNNDAALRIDRFTKKIHVIGKYQASVAKNKVLQELIVNLTNLGFSI